MSETPMGDGLKRVEARATVPVGGQIYQMTAEVLVREDVQLMPVVNYQPDGSAIVGLYGNPSRKPYALSQQQPLHTGGDDPVEVEDQPYWWDE